tara:strand:+ start:1058 stop:1288 length:231 start_codon:yes stop_codon:yes gene_type:complete
MKEHGLPLIYVVLVFLFVIFLGLFTYDQFTGNVLLSFDLKDGENDGGKTVGIFLSAVFLIIILLIFKHLKDSKKNS